MPHVCLGGTKMQVGELESHGCQVDKSSGHVDESRGQTKASTVLNTGETVTMDNGGVTGAKPGTGDARRDGAGPDGLGNWSDASIAHRDVPCTPNGTNTTADATEYISIPRKCPPYLSNPRDGLLSVSSACHVALPVGESGSSGSAGTVLTIFCTCPATFACTTSHACLCTCSACLHGFLTRLGHLSVGSRAAQACRGHAYMCTAMGTTREHL